jgi:hypothetical protein
MSLGRSWWNRSSLAVTALFAALLAVFFFLTLLAAPESGLTAEPGSTGPSQTTDVVYSYTVYLPIVTRPLGPYIDNFDDPASGWYVGPAVRYNDWYDYDGEHYTRDEEVAYMSYDQGNYHIYVPLTWHGGGDVDTWFVWPAEVAPLPDEYYPLPENYCIEARGVFANSKGDDDPYSAHWGIVFGASDDLSELYTYQVNANQAIAALRFHNYEYPGNRQPLSGTEINVEIPIVGWSSDSEARLTSDEYNTLRIVVNGSNIRLIANGRQVTSAYVPNIPRDRIGVIGGNWEVTPVDIAIDYFKYEPNCTE